MKTKNNWRRVLSILFAFVTVFGITLAGTVTALAEETNQSLGGIVSVADTEGLDSELFVATVGGERYETLKAAVEAASLVEGGATVELIGDATVSESITVSGDVTVVGEYTIYRADDYTGTLFTVSEGASLTLDGGITLDGANDYAFDKDAFMEDAVDNWNTLIPKEESAKWFTPEENAPVATAFMITTNGGTVNLFDVTVQNNYSISYGVVSVGAGSDVTLSGAKITHVAATQGNGVIVNASGADINVTVNAGTVIDGNHVGGNHGLFKIYSGAVLTVNGGEITNNTGWNSNGVAVGVYRGTFYLSGGLISSNVGAYGPANGRNAAIYLHSGHTFVMSGGTVSNNSGRARGGIDAPYDNGTAIITGGEVLDNISRGNGSEYDVLGTSSMSIKGGVFSQDVSKWIDSGLGIRYNAETKRYEITEHVFNLWFYDPVSGEQASVGPIQGGDLASVIAYGKLFYADYYVMELELLASTKVDETIVIDYPMTIDLNGYTVTAADTLDSTPIFRILSDVTVKGGRVDARGGNGSYAFIVGSAEAFGNLTVESGVYMGDVSAISVTKGTLTVNGGSFAADPYVVALDDAQTNNYSYVINCIDANYKDGTAQVVINGGVFYKFNPQDNAAEGEGTNFVGSDRRIVADGDYYTVYEREYVAEVDGVKYESFDEALEVAKSSESKVMVVYKTVVIDEDGVIDLGGVRVNAGASLQNAPVFRILADVTFENGIVDGYGDGSGAINVYAFIVGDTESAGTLTVISGTYRGVTSAISITNGTVNIVGGTFQTKHDGEGVDYGSAYLLNCIDSAYNSGAANFNITGGKFVGFNPESNVSEGEGTNYLADGYKASDYYGDNKWYVAKANVVMDGDKYFATVKDALAILASADTTVHTVKILEDIEIDVNYSTYNYPILVNGFSIILDLGGKTVSADWSEYTGTRVDNALIGVVNGGKITIVDSVGGGMIINNDNRANVENRIFWIMTSTAEKQIIVDIQGGIFVQNDLNTALLYIQGDTKSSGGAGVIVTIRGGRFESVNDDFFNAYDGHVYNAEVLGGIFNKDPRDNEIRIPAHLTSYQNADGYWGITEAVATVGNKGYATLDEAFAAAEDGETVQLLVNVSVSELSAQDDDVTVSETIVISESIVLDLGGNTVSGSDIYPVIRIQNDAVVTVKNGTVTNNDYIFVLGAADGSSAGYLTVENGAYIGATSVISVTKGKLTVLGGEFTAVDSQYGYRYLLNCIDESYRDGTATIEVLGGSFYGFNPASNAAEGEGTSFVPAGYYVTYNSDTGFYTVSPLIKFYSSNLLLGNTIGIYFNIKTEDLVDGVNYVAVFTIHGVEYTIPRYDENGKSNWVVKSDKPEITKILFEGIAAKEMTLPVSVVLKLGDEIVSNTVSESVKSYVERGIERGIFTAEDMDLVIQMINYGALAQQSFGYKTDDLANTGENAAAALADYTRAAGSYTNNMSGTGYYGASLNLENNIGFNFKFYADGLETAEKAVITYVNHTGKAMSVEVALDEFKREMKNDRELIVVHIGTLYAADAMQMLKCRILDKDGNVLAYANDSIESYCARAIAGLGAMPASLYETQSFGIEFYQALMKYAMASYDYDKDTVK